MSVLDDDFIYAILLSKLKSSIVFRITDNEYRVTKTKTKTKTKTVSRFSSIVFRITNIIEELRLGLRLKRRPRLRLRG